MAAGLFHRLHHGVVDLDAVRREHGHLVVVHVADLAGVLDERGDIGGDHAEALAVAQNQGAGFAGGDELVRVGAAENAQGIGALNPGEHLGDGGQDVLLLVLIVVLQQLRHHLGVGVGDKVKALGDQKLLDFHVVFDNTVVHHSHRAVFAHMGVGVDVVRLAVGGPAGVADAELAVEGGALVGEIGQRLQTALGLGDLQAGGL